MKYNILNKKHPKLYSLLRAEQKRQAETINLIASENYVSEAVLEALGTEFTNKYAEGKSHARYYFGNEVVDEMEDYTKSLALKMFKLKPSDWGVNVQPYSGSPANLAVYTALLQPGDTVLSMNLIHGGHLTHGSPVSITGKLWNFVYYGVNKKGFIDYDEVLKLAQKYKPKMIVCGATAYSRILDFKRFGQITKKIGAYLLADISHIAGLVVGGAHSSPFNFADVVTTTTHKTLRGPRGAVIFSRANIIGQIDRAVFPGLQGGPHANQIFAMAVAFEEALKSDFKKYARQVLKNAKVLAVEFKKYGFPVVSDGTDNHLILIDVTPFGFSGQTAGQILETAGIIVNKNMIPYDTRKPNDPSGLRIGTPAVTTLGMKEKDMRIIALLIKQLLVDRINPVYLKYEVRKMIRRFI